MRRARVLVVEDERIVAEDLQSQLETFGYSVSSIASSGEEAIQKAVETHPDLVLMDIVLKGNMDGVEVAEKMHASLDIPVVYLTAYGDVQTVQRAKITEPYGYILKPFDERELHTSIEMALYKHRMERKLKENEQWLATTLKSIGDGVIATNSLDGITFMNRVAEELTGWSQDEALNKAVAEVYSIVNDHPLARTEGRRSRPSRDDPPAEYAHRAILIAKDGTAKAIEHNVSPIKDERGVTTGTVVVFRDITERRRAEEERARLLNELQEAGAKLNLLTGLLPICAWCKKIRDDEGYWNQLERYIEKHSDAQFTHGICPDCLAKQRPRQIGETD
jgi:PAS domain S-box-containing protein